MKLAAPNLYLYGPPGSGKTTVGRALAHRLGRSFIDSDDLIVERAGKDIPRVFAEEGEAAFRSLEAEICLSLAGRAELVVACGGGALLNEQVRRALEGSGTVVCLRCSTEQLEARLQAQAARPLLAGGPGALQALLEDRRSHYDSYDIQVDTSDRPVEAVVDIVLREQHDSFVRVLPVDQPPGYEVHLGAGLLRNLRELAEGAGLRAPFVIVADESVSRLYANELQESLPGPLVEVPSGEANKTLKSASRLYAEFLEFGLERGGSVVAFGGGVIGDLAGFAAATYMRGVRWLAVPTTLLAMVDASIGGKVGVDLPQGKNLVGAFYPPARVVTDTDTLATLPETEFRAGLAELLKAAVIGDPELLGWIERGDGLPTLRWIERALAVKIAVVEADPHEGGARASLNFGHTIAHGIEAAADYSLRHGEAVAIGMVGETMLAEALGIAEAGLGARLGTALDRLGLPTAYAGLNPDAIRRAMDSDKKRAQGQLKFALPVAPGDVRIGVEVPEDALRQVLTRLKGDS